MGGGVALLSAPRIAPSAASAAAESPLAASPASLALISAAVAMGVALAVLIARAPRRHAHLMVVCTVGAGAAAVSLLVAYVAGDGGGAALAGLVLALGLAASTFASWLALWLAPCPSHATRARDERLRAALLEALLPASDGTDQALLREALEQALRDAQRRGDLALRRGDVALRVVLRILDAASRIERRRAFAELDAASRERLLSDLARSRFSALRRIGLLLERDVLARYYADPRVHREIGFDTRWLRGRFVAGPNRLAHEAREEAERQAREEAERLAREAALAALAEPEPVIDETPGAEAPPEEESGNAPPPAPADDVPLDRPWTLGVVREPISATLALGTPIVKALRNLGPTRP